MDYEADFYAWTQAQAAALRRAAALRPNVGAEIDWEHLADEVESMGTSEKHEIASRLEVLLAHLLKLALARHIDSRHGWMRTVREQRDRINDRLTTSPSLRRHASDVLPESYRRARRGFLSEYNIETTPGTCPFDLEREILAEEWFPPEAG
jgi:hypothetical protein